MATSATSGSSPGDRYSRTAAPLSTARRQERNLDQRRKADIRPLRLPNSKGCIGAMRASSAYRRSAGARARQCPSAPRSPVRRFSTRSGSVDVRHFCPHRRAVQGLFEIAASIDWFADSVGGPENHGWQSSGRPLTNLVEGGLSATIRIMRKNRRSVRQREDGRQAEPAEATR